MMIPKIIVTARAIIRDLKGRILLQKRSDYGDWGLPGGAMEPGETIEETMLREVREETGLDLNTFNFYAVYSGPRMHYIYPDGNHIVFIMFLFEATIDFAGKLCDDYLLFSDPYNESLSLRLFDLIEIDSEMISSVQRPVFEDLKQNKLGIFRT